MKVYKVKDLQVFEVECEEMKYPLYDADGDKIYINTHFATKKEAYKQAFEVCDASISLAASDIETLRGKIKERETCLADYAIAREQLKREMRRQEAG